MNEQTLQLHKKVKRLNLKSLGVMALYLIVLIALVSVFAGWPLPYKSEILGIVYWNDGWILVCLVTLVLVLVWKAKQIIQIFQPVFSVLNDECDAQALLEEAEVILEYVKSKKGAAAKIVRTQTEGIYIIALDALGRYDDAMEYLNTKWMSKKRLRNIYIQQIKRNKYSVEQNKEEYLKIYEKLPKNIKKNPMCTVQKYRVEGYYESALEILRTVTYKNLYERVTIAFAYASCYIAMGKMEEAKEHIDFVIKYGNTLAIKQRAQTHCKSLYTIE